MIIAKQLNEIQKKNLDCIKIVKNDSDITDIQADIYGPEGTPYHQGKFRCKLVLTSDFPRTAPKGFFLTKIYHPNVSANGEICVNTLKKDWNPTQWNIQNIFEVIKCLLIIPFPESSLNEEAGKQFMEDYNSYFKYAKLYTDLYAFQGEEQYERNNKKFLDIQITNSQQQQQQNSLNFQFSQQNVQQNFQVKGNMIDENEYQIEQHKYSPRPVHNLLLENKQNQIDDKCNEFLPQKLNFQDNFKVPINLTFSSSFGGSQNQNFMQQKTTVLSTQSSAKKEQDKKKWLKRI